MTPKDFRLPREVARRRAILVDFGGVLTTSVFAGFRAFGRSIGVDPDLPICLIASDAVVNSAFVEFEAGRRSDEHFEEVLAEALTEHGGTVEADGLLRRLRSEIGPDPEMIELIAGVRAAGHPVALVSNSLGRDCYDDVDIAALVDVAVVSAEVGLRKPDRAIYELACARLEVEPGEAVMIDDLTHNVDGARRAGIDGIVHGNASTTAEELAVRFGVFPLLPPTPVETNRCWRSPGSRSWLH
ncbi:putative hydrolase of the HAD superfamily [Nocardia amikacinitolerans]|uniref:HAD family hydrolase n=1 Tax=Nocardia amikacinitolerans TaxID=756689 RepID=UPI00082DC18B|nr:HAD family phosphatase [Nocardia amikacinitolerans]MCP2315117.1 putative hydrolase of the HAD superfamily [Nocardia amikacinitolerans]